MVAILILNAYKVYTAGKGFGTHSSEGKKQFAPAIMLWLKTIGCTGRGETAEKK